MGLSQAVTKVVGLVTALVLMRLLSPAEFGLMAMATAIATFTASFTSTGFESALIQRKDDAEEYLDIVWTVEFIRHLFLFLCVSVIGFFFGAKLGDPELAMVIPAVALLFVLKAFQNIGIIYFQKKLDFKMKIW